MKMMENMIFEINFTKIINNENLKIVLNFFIKFSYKYFFIKICYFHFYILIFFLRQIKLI